MKRIALTLTAWLALSLTASAQSVTLPATVTAEPKESIILVPDKVAKDAVVQWRLDVGLVDETAKYERIFGTKAVGKFLRAAKAGTYKVYAWVPGDAEQALDRASVLTILNDAKLTDAVKVERAQALLSGVSICYVVVGDPGPTPPDPPGPKPPVPPDPPAPTPQALRVLMVYETADLPKMPAKQQLVLYAKDVRDYLATKCVVGPDGKTREWRIWDKDSSTANESKEWQATRAASKTVPGIVIMGGTTNAVLYEGPLPATKEDALALLKRFAEGVKR